MFSYRNPYAIQDTTRMNMTCRADDGAAMKPMDILGGFDGKLGRGGSRGGGWQGVQTHPPLEYHKWLYVSLEILARNPCVQLLLDGDSYSPL